MYWRYAKELLSERAQMDDEKRQAEERKRLAAAGLTPGGLYVR